ncbi:MAG: glycosyltransferase [Planctomycetota bacterium]|nr:glycosyltransferase [Planctomycetota bacterium]
MTNATLVTDKFKCATTARKEPRADNRPASLLVFSDDWGRHPSSCQHLVGRLLDRYSVNWVNTIGTRTPKLDWATLSRVFEKLRQWRARRSVDATRDDTPSRVPRFSQPTIINPKMWPWFTHRHDRRLNRALLTRQLHRVIESMPQPVTTVSTIPITADLVGRLPVAKWVYYCVDDFSEWPGLDGRTMARMDLDMIRAADEIVAVSEHLQEHIARHGRESHLLTHGVDQAMWAATTEQHHTGDTQRRTVLDELQSPRVVFWGVVDRRMDFEFVAKLANSMDRGSITLIGPQQNPDPRLLALPRVSAIPAVPFDELPRIAATADVLVMPYIDAPVTHAMQPLKLKEYLATGKPVVVRKLPSTYDWRDCMDVAQSAEQFVELVHARGNGVISDKQRAARSRLANEGWDAKAIEFEQWLATSNRG